MNLINLVKVGVACAALIFSYWMGVQHGRESEELKNARLEIQVLKKTIEDFRLKQTNDALALSELRISESAHPIPNRSRHTYPPTSVLIFPVCQ